MFKATQEDTVCQPSDGASRTSFVSAGIVSTWRTRTRGEAAATAGIAALEQWTAKATPGNYFFSKTGTKILNNPKPIIKDL